MRSGKYGSGEGVVAKGLLPGKKAPHGIWMAKVKTRAWLVELKRRCAENAALKQVLAENTEEQEDEAGGNDGCTKR